MSVALVFEDEKAVINCDYCHDTPATMHFFLTAKNVCGSQQCERMARQEAARKETRPT